MSDHNAFHVISNIQTDLYILRGISKLVLAMETAMEKGEDDPAVFFPGLFAIHCQLDDFEKEIDKECQSYFEYLQKDKATENQDELLSVLKEKPELVPNTLDFHGKSCALAEGRELASSAAVYTNAALASNGPVYT